MQHNSLTQHFYLPSPPIKKKNKPKMLGQLISCIPHSISLVRNDTAEERLHSGLATRRETRAAPRTTQTAEAASAGMRKVQMKKASPLGPYTELCIHPVEIQAQSHLWSPYGALSGSSTKQTP